MNNYEITNGKLKLKLNSDKLNYTVSQGGYIWESQGRNAHIDFRIKLFNKSVSIRKKFSSAKNICHHIANHTIVSTFSDFKVLGKLIKIVVVAKAKILDSEKIDFSIEALCEDKNTVVNVCYPRAFNAVNYAKNMAYSVDPIRQGTLIKDNWKKNRFAIFILTKYRRKINSGDAYIPIFGRVCDGHGYSAVADDFHDASIFSSYGRKKAFLTSFCWRSSLGQLSYIRTAHFSFYNNCDYVKIAKDFRIQEIEKGNFVTIDEKIKNNPNVAGLAGMPIIHWRLLEHNVKESRYYKKTKIGEKLHNSCQDSIDKFTKYKSMGLRKAYVHTDGWGYRGYDNLHPYILPPSKKIGGYDGLRNLSVECGKIGYKFGLHDQYRDFYLDCPTFDKNLAVTNIDGKRYFCNIWSGGAHNWLCGTFYMDYLKRTYSELDEQNINIDGVYLDVFGIVPGDECFNEKHVMSRKQNIEKRKECFQFLRDKGMIVSSEEPGCLMVGVLDLLHHAPYAVTPQGGGRAVGIPIPLTNLVYHDSVFVPWIVDGKGGWGIPNDDFGKLHCILNGQNPYFNPNDDKDNELSDSKMKERIAAVNEICEVNKLVYNAEMVSHRFVDKNCRIQESKFSNGYVITVDFDKGVYNVNKIK